MHFYKQYPNGLRLVAEQMDSCYTVSFGIMVNVGSIREDEQTNGLSHFVEHLLFKGTQKRTAQQISEELDDIGANLNAYTSKDVTCYYTKSIAEDLEKCIDVLSDMYFNASFPADELEKERGVVLEEISSACDNPEDVSADLIMGALFNTQPLGQTILGNRDIIKYCDRHSIIEFKQKHYFPANTVVSVAGKFDFDELDDLVSNYFNVDQPCNLVAEIEPACNYTNDFLHEFKDVNQAHLQLAWGGCNYQSKEYEAMCLMCNTLGGGMSSRLFQSIREQHGLVYSIYSYPSFYTHNGSVEIYAGLSPDNIDKFSKLIKEEIDKFVTDGISQKELERGKVQAVNHLLMGLENNLSLMRVFGRFMLKTNTVYDVVEQRRAYERLTVDDVNRVARNVFATPYASSYVGPDCKQFDTISKIKF